MTFKRQNVFLLIAGAISLLEVGWRFSASTYAGHPIKGPPFGISDLSSVEKEIRKRVVPGMSDSDVRQTLGDAKF